MGKWESCTGLIARGGKKRGVCLFDGVRDQEGKSVGSVAKPGADLGTEVSSFVFVLRHFPYNQRWAIAIGLGG